MGKKIFKIIGVFVLLLLATAFAAPFLFKGKIIKLVKEEINKNLNAKVDFKDVDISFFRSFPKVAVGLEDIEIVGKGVFVKDTLLLANKIDVALDLISVIKAADMKVYSVDVESPKIHAIVNKEGIANWDIVIEDSLKTDNDKKSAPFTLNLNSYSINNATIRYTDLESNMSSEIFNLNHKGSGDFTADLFTLKTKTTADAVTFIYNGVPYLSNATASIDTDIQVDNKINRYSYNTQNILVNDLRINSNGSIVMLSEGYDLDIKFNAPSTEFKSLLSLVPSIYKNDFDKIKTSGKAIFGGFVKGVYNDIRIPAYHVDVRVENGFFQYPDLPKPVKDINLIAVVENPDGITDHTVVHVEKGHIQFDNDPVDFNLLVKNPISDLYIDAAAKGKIDLNKLSQFVKFEKGTKISGLIDADVYVKGLVSAIEKQQFDKFTSGGKVLVSNLLYVSNEYPTGVKVNSLASSFSPQKVDITNFSGQYLATNFSGTGQINNLLNYALKNKPLNASLSFSADKVNLNDWMGTSTDTTVSGAAAAPFVVPDNVDITLITKINQLHYDKIDIQELSGSLKVWDETVKINEAKGNALEGTIAMDGFYSTKLSKTKPDISLNYKVVGVDVQKTFYAFNTVQSLMPIGKFIAGKLTSQLSLTGKLGENMMPDMSSLTGKGDMFLLEGFLSKFAPLDKIASTLHVSALEKISLKDIKNQFEFANGKLFVKPFKVKLKDIEMEIGGMQGFDQSLDFLVNMKLPRALMGAKGNQLVNNLVTQINSKGVPMQVGEMVNLNMNLGGFIKNPILKTNLQQSAGNMADQLKQQAMDFAKAKVDSTKQAVTSAVKDTVSAIKNQAISNAKEELKKKLFGGKDTGKIKTDSPQAVKPKPQEQVKGLINNLFKKKAKDTLNTP